MSEEFVLQMSIKGRSASGLELMLNVRGPNKEVYEGAINYVIEKGYITADDLKFATVTPDLFAAERAQAASVSTNPHDNPAQYAPRQSDNGDSGPLPDEKPCPIHKEMMKKRDGKNGPFYSHKTTDPDYSNGWCNGRPAKK